MQSHARGPPASALGRLAHLVHTSFVFTTLAPETAVPLHRRTRHAASIAVCLLTACSSGSAEPGTPEPVGGDEERILLERDFTGTASLGGSTLPLRLRMAGPARDLIVTLTIPDLDVTANGEGELMGRRLRLALEYGSECTGEILIDGTTDDDVRRVEGRLTARDCTGEEEGTVVLRVR